MEKPTITPISDRYVDLVGKKVLLEVSQGLFEKLLKTGGFSMSLLEQCDYLFKARSSSDFMALPLIVEAEVGRFSDAMNLTIRGAAVAWLGLPGADPERDTLYVTLRKLDTSVNHLSGVESNGQFRLLSNQEHEAANNLRQVSEDKDANPAAYQDALDEFRDTRSHFFTEVADAMAVACRRLSSDELDHLWGAVVTAAHLQQTETQAPHKAPAHSAYHTYRR